MSQVAAIAKLGAVVLATFTVCWAPYLTSPSVALGVLQVRTSNKSKEIDDTPHEPSADRSHTALTGGTRRNLNPTMLLLAEIVDTH